MVTRILEARWSVEPVLAYNMEKVWDGNAAMIAVRNVGGGSYYAALGLMHNLETNPALSARARSMAFHMTVGPGADDEPMDDDAILSYVDEVMTALGRGKQPYVVFRHEDIDRMHYHVVSVNATPEGRMIDRRNDAYRLRAVQGELAAKYGFHVGLPDDAGKKAVRPARMKAGMKDVIATMRADFNDVLSWRLPAPANASMLCALGAWGIEAKVSGGTDAEDRFVSLRGVDAKGRPVGRLISSRRILGRDMLEYTIESYEHHAERDDEAHSVADAVSRAMAESDSIARLQAALARLHIHLHLLAADDENAKRKAAALRHAKGSREIVGALLADRRTRRVYRLEELGIELSRIKALSLRETRHAAKVVSRKKATRGRKLGL